MAQINLCLRKVSLPTTVVGVIVSNILGLSLTILLGARLLDHIGNLFLPMATTLSTMFTIVLGTFAGFVYKWSTKCVTKFRKNCTAPTAKMERHVVERVIRSCTPMKIRFGNNFIVISTPLVILGFCAKYTVRVLLMK